MGKPGGKDLKSGSALNLNCRVCASESGAKNSAGTVRVLMEEKAADAEKRAAGATETLSESSNLPHSVTKIFEYAWALKKQGYAEQTIHGRVKLLKRLVKLGANLYDPESVKEVIAKQKWSAGRKELAVEPYSSFLKIFGGKWDPPKYRRVRKLPFIPLESEIDQLIAGCGRKTATLLQLLKETGVRIGEAWRLKWVDIDFANSTVRITPEKGSEPRIFKVSDKLMSMLRSLQKDSSDDRVFPKLLRSQERLFYKARKKVSEKLKNPRIMQISFHTFRHWKATTEYAKTKDILHVMRLLGHKDIKNTLVYTQLVNFGGDEYVAKVAHSEEEACKLVEAGFEYVCDFNGNKIFRKRK
jgi:integrase